MNASLKLSLYGIAVLGTLLFGILFARTWRTVNGQDTAPVVVAGGKAGVKKAAVSTASVTNGVDGALTNAVSNGSGMTNETAEAVSTNEVASTESAADREPAVELRRVTVGGKGWSRLLLYGLLGLACVAGLASLIAYDVTQYAGNRTTDALFDHDGEGIPDSVDDLVDKAYGDGDFLEAVRILREHLSTNPRAHDAQIRIAEIYEKDLNNPLAAALEYEEVLKLSLPVEKRGWTMIHLVNLFNRMEKPDQALAWLQRVVSECPGTPAAGKARERLMAAGLEVPEETGESASGAGDGSSPESEPPSGLPRGFRRKGS